MTTDFTSLILGETNEAIEINTASDVNLAATTLCLQTKRTLDIASRDLDRKIFDQENFSKALFELATRGRFSQIRFLTHNNDDAVRKGHEVLRLTKRLSSYIQIKLISDEFKSFNESFVIADKKGVIYRGMADRYDALVNFNHPRLAHELQVQFDEMWAHSEFDPNFRELRI